MHFNYRIFEMEVGTMWRFVPVRGFIGGAWVEDWLGELVVIEKVDAMFDLAGNDPLIHVRKYGDVANGRSQTERCAVVGSKCLRRP